MFYISIWKPGDKDYEDTATNLKSARAKAYSIVKEKPKRHVMVYDTDPTKFRSASDVMNHRRGWAWKVSRTTYWTTDGVKAYKLKSDGTIVKE